MHIAYELKKPLFEVMEWDRGEIGYWFAYLKLKAEEEAKTRRKTQRQRT